MSELGLLKDYGHIIMSAVLVLYGFLYTYLCNKYGAIDED